MAAVLVSAAFFFYFFFAHFKNFCIFVEKKKITRNNKPSTK